MNLIINQYLASLQERDELDAIFPDLLSQMGLVVFSKPGRGTRQDGVDVAAVGSIDGGKEKVYLFSLKAGDLTRSKWDGDSIQSLRPSLNEILDSYIPNRLPVEHKDKDIVICICIGGDVQEQVRPQVEGYIKENKKHNISFEEWNGDKLANLIQKYLLQEELLPSNAQSLLRKSLALLDEPQSSFLYFSKLICLLDDSLAENKKDRLIIIRQINICLWILFSWARDMGNLESAYLASEISLLHAWNIAKDFFKSETKNSIDIQDAFASTLYVYHQINSKYIQKLIPFSFSLHSMSILVNASNSLDVNLKLFEVLGRFALHGLWGYWGLSHLSDKETKGKEEYTKSIRSDFQTIISLIHNNPALLLPIKDDQAIDISIAVLFLMLGSDNRKQIIFWLTEMVNRAAFSLQTNGQYPCTLQNYSDLIVHPQRDDKDYKDRVTSGSILFPFIGLWAALQEDLDLYSEVQKLKNELLPKCNFQFWYPDESSEALIYTNLESHGATLSNVCIGNSPNDYLHQVFGECEHTKGYEDLSAVKSGFWPLIVVACRQYRLPLPVRLWHDFFHDLDNNSGDKPSQ